MRAIPVSLCILCLLAFYAGCKRGSQVIAIATASGADAKSRAGSTAGNPDEATVSSRFDVCALLKREEISAVAGSPIDQNSGSERSNGSFRVSQCVYIAHQPDRSISLVVTHTEPTARKRQSPRDFWRDKFGRYRGEHEKSEEKERDDARNSNTVEREDEERRPPRKIEDLGEEAFWTAGSLYVLQGDVFLRLSIGGSDSEQTKLEHTKALASLALKRLGQNNAK